MPGFVLVIHRAVEMWTIWGAAGLNWTGLNWAVDMKWMNVPFVPSDCYFETASG